MFGPYPAKVISEHDGDTITLDIDLGFGIHIVSGLACRIYGINAPELSTPAGKAALEFVKATLKIGDQVLVTSHGWDKYGGRFDGSVTLPDGRDFALVLLAANQAAPMKD